MLLKECPPHLIGKGLKLIEEMVRDGLLLEHKGGKCVSVNLKMKEEVERLRALFLEKRYISKLR